MRGTSASSSIAAPILILQHHPVETPGVFSHVLAEHGLATRAVRPDLGDAVPPTPDGFGGIVVMGGPMGVYEEDRYPWLREEQRLLQAAIRRDAPTLGVCLGSQLVAKAAGARVYPGPEKEIGWYPLSLTDAGREDPLLSAFPERFDAFEWHGDVFDLPDRAVALVLGSPRCPHQAFRIGRRVYGVLFHLEVTAEMVAAMTQAFADEIVALADPGRLAAIESDLDSRTASANRLARRLLGAFVTLAARQRRRS